MTASTEKLKTEGLAEMLQVLVSACVKAAASSEKLLTIEELAERLQLTVPVVRAYVKARKIPVIGLNPRVWRFHWPTVLRALEQL